MCRLTLYTDTTYAERLSWIDRLLLMAQADGDQSDGCGISNGQYTYKTATEYANTIPGWMTVDDFKTADRILAHVRKASAYTGKTDREAHPYNFVVRDSPFVAAHNGYINGTGAHVYQSQNPDTDSWRAFSRLAGIVEREGVLDAAVMREWLSEYQDTSLIAIMVLWNGASYIFRHNKPLHYAVIGDGYLVHTSPMVLARFKNYLSLVHKVEIGAVAEVPENTLVTITPQNTIVTQPVEVTLKEGAFRQQSLPKPEQSAATTGGQAAETGGAQTKTTAITGPITAADVVDTMPSATTKIWKDIARIINPMRISLFMPWFKDSMGVESEDDTVKGVSAATDIATLLIFVEMIGQFTPRQRQLLNVWNSMIERRHDAHMHEVMYCKNWFWLDPDFTNPATSDEEAIAFFKAVTCGCVIDEKLFDSFNLTKLQIQQILEA